MTPQDYAAQLLAPLAQARAPAESPRAALPACAWFRPALPQLPVSLRDLYLTGIECGHGESRQLLEERIGAYDAEMEAALARERAARRELATAHRDLEEAWRLHAQEVKRLEADALSLRLGIRALEKSTSWRLTAPMRGLTLAARQAWRRLRGSSPGLMPAPPPAAPAACLEPGIGTLHVPTSEAPRVSVIVPAYGQDLYTFTCLKALATEAGRLALEVIVMDDCAPVPAAQALRSVSGVRFERNAANLGFVRNCNRGAALARGEYLLFLNNDAVLAPGSIEALLEIFARYPHAGGAGAKLLFPDGRLQEAGAIVWRDGTAWNDGRGGDADRPEYNYVREADYCSAACLMVPRALFAGLEGFDERFVPAYCEDADLCFRLRAAGHPVYYQPAASAVHFEGVSHGTSTDSGVKRHQVENQARFRERWQQTLATHRESGDSPRLERDRAARYRVLVVEACMLTPDQDSGSMRTWRLLEEMQRLGCKVTFVAENLEGAEPYTSRLQQAGVEVLHEPHVTSVEAIIAERGAEFDVIVLSRYYVAERHIGAVRNHAPAALLVLDTIDLHYLRQRRLATLEGSQALAQAARKTYRQEIDCIRASDITWVVSGVERDLLALEVPRATVIVQTNIHDVVAPARPFAQREGLLFVGGYRHPPNVDAAAWYASEIVPILRELLPGVTTYMVGSNAPQAVLELEGEGLEVVGHVPDLQPWFERCRLSVSPLRYGAGVKGKVNQSMAHGLPVVATSASVEGMHIVEGKEVVIADDARSFAQAVARLYRDEAAWSALSRAGMDNVARHFSREVAARALAELFALLERRRRQGRPP